MNDKHFGPNIQTFRKLKGMKQQELADAIGINLQSLSKIERGVYYPTFETLEKIMVVLEVAPNEMLSGTWKFASHIEKEVCQRERTIKCWIETRSLWNFFDSEEEWLEYELEQLREYVTDYINGKDITASNLYPIKEFVKHLKFQKILDRYDEFYSLDMFVGSTEGHKRMPPYVPFAKRNVIVNMNILMFKMNILYPLTEDTTNKKSDQECKHHLRW